MSLCKKQLVIQICTKKIYSLGHYAVVGVRRSSSSVCDSVCQCPHNKTKTAASTINHMSSPSRVLASQ